MIKHKQLSTPELTEHYHKCVTKIKSYYSYLEIPLQNGGLFSETNKYYIKLYAEHGLTIPRINN